jgi:hypothetical protein
MQASRLSDPPALHGSEARVFPIVVREIFWANTQPHLLVVIGKTER